MLLIHKRPKHRNDLVQEIKNYSNKMNRKPMKLIFVSFPLTNKSISKIKLNKPKKKKLTNSENINVSFNDISKGIEETTDFSNLIQSTEK